MVVDAYIKELRKLGMDINVINYLSNQYDGGLISKLKFLYCDVLNILNTLKIKKRNINIYEKNPTKVFGRIDNNNCILLFLNAKDIIEQREQIINRKLKYIYFCQHTEFWAVELQDQVWVIRNAIGVISVSKYLYQLTNNFSSNIQNNLYISNPRLMPPKSNQYLSAPHRLYDYCFYLSHQWWKGYSDSLEFIRILRVEKPNAVIVAFGSLRCEYAIDMLKNNGVIFFGIIKPAKVQQIFTMTKLFVYTSYFEGYGLLAQEAIDCGAKVLSYDNKGIGDIESENLYVVPFRSFHKMKHFLMSWEPSKANSGVSLKLPSIFQNSKILKQYLEKKIALI